MTNKKQSIYEELNLSEYKNYDSISRGKLAWIGSQKIQLENKYFIHRDGD